MKIFELQISDEEGEIRPGNLTSEDGKKRRVASLKEERTTGGGKQGMGIQRAPDQCFRVIRGKRHKPPHKERGIIKKLKPKIKIGLKEGEKFRGQSEAT